MKAIFLSDVHLKRLTDPGSERCMIFLDHLLGKGKETQEPFNDTMITTDLLVIAGDFFDFWFERNGIVYPEFRPVINKLIQLKQSGVKISFCEGNHDFFLSDYFVKALDAEVIEEWASISLDGKRILISHGDTINRRDTKYLLLRRFLRSAFFYKLQLALPAPFLWRVAQIISGFGKTAKAQSAHNLLEKMRAFSSRKLRDGFDAVILGHCHKHLLEEIMISGKVKTFAVLGDWVRQFSYLCYENGNFVASTFQPSGGYIQKNISRSYNLNKY